MQDSLKRGDFILSEGAMLNNRIQINKCTDSTEFCRNYLGFDTKTNTKVIVKELVDVFDSNVKREQAAKQFQIEASILTGLVHPSIPKFRDYFEENGKRYIIMDHVEGKSLFDAVKETKGFLDEKLIIQWGMDLCDVLNYLHTRKPNPVIFRSMNPNNVISSQDKSLKLVDFGISKIFAPETKTMAVAKTTNPNFSPIEQYAGLTDARSDIYSLGATLYYIVTKTLPMDALDRSINDSPLTPCREINSSLSRELETIIIKAMELNKEGRYQTALEMQQSLRTLSRNYGGKASTVEEDKGPVRKPFVPFSEKGSDKPSGQSGGTQIVQLAEETLNTQHGKFSLGDLSKRPRKFDTRSLGSPIDYEEDERTSEIDSKTASEALETGTLVDGRFKVLEIISSGELTRRYKALDINKNIYISLKELIDRADDPVKKKHAITQFQIEAKILLKLVHSNIPKFEDYFTYNGRRYIATELFEGESLQSVIADTSSILDETTLVNWAVQLCDILEYMHSQEPEPVIYRDMCPKNIIVGEDNNLKIVDFSISKLFNPEEKTVAAAKIINPHFSPVEQYCGQTDERSDIYSLGATLYYLTTKTLPVDAIDRSITRMQLTSCCNFNNKVTEKFNEILIKSLEIDKQDRYQTIKEMKEDFSALAPKKVIKTSSAKYQSSYETGKSVKTQKANPPGLIARIIEFFKRLFTKEIISNDDEE
jgi:serine/threonine protein kinase